MDVYIVYLLSCVCPVKGSWYKSLWKIPTVPSTNGYRLMSRGIKYGMVQLSSSYGWMGQNRLYVVPRWFHTCYALTECNSVIYFHHFLPIFLIICFQFKHKTSIQWYSKSQSSRPTPVSSKLMLSIGISRGVLRRTLWAKQQKGDYYDAPSELSCKKVITTSHPLSYAAPNFST